jgi:hypothetical protein
MLDKGTLASMIESAFRSVEPGEDSVNSLANLLANAIDTFVKSGKVQVDSIGGTCKHAGSHPPIYSEGQVV